MKKNVFLITFVLVIIFSSCSREKKDANEISVIAENNVKAESRSTSRANNNLLGTWVYDDGEAYTAGEAYITLKADGKIDFMGHPLEYTFENGVLKFFEGENLVMEASFDGKVIDLHGAVFRKK